MNIWQTIIAALGGTALLLGAVAWLVKKIIVHFLDKDVEAYKVKLQADSNQKLEAFKTELRLIEFRSTKLHDKRAEAVAEIYEKLAVAIEVAENFVHSGISAMSPGQEQRAQETQKALKDFKACFDRRRIYFDESICKMLDDFYQNVRDPAMLFDTTAITSDPNDRKLLFDTRRELLQKIREKAKPIRNALENEFRRILGVVDGLH